MADNGGLNVVKYLDGITWSRGPGITLSQLNIYEFCVPDESSIGRGRTGKDTRS